MPTFAFPDKSNVLEVFKIYKLKFGNQLKWKINTVWSERGGDYYRNYDYGGKRMGSLESYFLDYRIEDKDTVLGMPVQNGVSKRRKRTPMDLKA